MLQTESDAGGCRAIRWCSGGKRDQPSKMLPFVLGGGAVSQNDAAGAATPSEVSALGKRPPSSSLDQNTASSNESPPKILCEFAR